MIFNCKRCDTLISFENDRCFLQNGIPHDIRKCNTIPGYVWCPAHRAKFSKRHPCEHYETYGYEPNSNEEFFIKLIIANYHTGDWYTRKNKRWTSKKMKKSICNKCNIPVYNMSQKEQLLHEKIHLDEKNNQNLLSEFF